MFDRAKHCREIAHLGGKARAAMQDFVEHNRAIAHLGGRALHDKYKLVPFNGSDFLLVNRETGKINPKTLNGNNTEIA